VEFFPDGKVHYVRKATKNTFTLQGAYLAPDEETLLLDLELLEGGRVVSGEGGTHKVSVTNNERMVWDAGNSDQVELTRVKWRAASPTPHGLDLHLDLDGHWLGDPQNRPRRQATGWERGGVYRHDPRAGRGGRSVPFDLLDG
jgi:hypothetical protein